MCADVFKAFVESSNEGAGAGMTAQVVNAFVTDADGPLPGPLHPPHLMWRLHPYSYWSKALGTNPERGSNAFVASLTANLTLLHLDGDETVGNALLEALCPKQCVMVQHRDWTEQHMDAPAITHAGNIRQRAGAITHRQGQFGRPS
ncbi:hypothetical protein D9Q98_007971 [Chlorella vulgaris]|uniref:Uncharacterized protein n=1 Tax=Chlorella vulgaris TaxID=3077 RepID=A0A9D4THT7_CHLVU|nr:hypothetical protein D9Q98_007971 [Chlorella vulgaris]